MSMNNIRKIVTDKYDVLNQYDFYRNAPKRLQEEIFAQATSVKLEPDTLFYERASRCEHVALIGSGSVRVYVVGDTGREITLYHVKPGETCPVNVITALLNMDTPAMAVVEVKLEAVLLPVKYFHRWISQQEIVRQFVFESFATRMIDILSLMEEIHFVKWTKGWRIFYPGSLINLILNPL